eukprot:12532336-Alexandrium_andersonii.AAC.1
MARCLGRRFLRRRGGLPYCPHLGCSLTSPWYSGGESLPVGGRLNRSTAFRPPRGGRSVRRSSLAPRRSHQDQLGQPEGRTIERVHRLLRALLGAGCGAGPCAT